MRNICVLPVASFRGHKLVDGHLSHCFVFSFFKSYRLITYGNWRRIIYWKHWNLLEAEDLLWLPVDLLYLLKKKRFRELVSDVVDEAVR